MVDLCLNRSANRFCGRQARFETSDGHRRLVSILFCLSGVLITWQARRFGVEKSGWLGVGGGLDGDRLNLKPPPAPPPPRRWLQRLDDWLLTIRS